ncbi:hypothetical protein EMIHUDRAFT_445959 [Emiliania huxleyi CCMP1516]|uniref:Uncharacterized protein n=2 Tax=Emiliania huxleyi TaxID=2903 RepID=A0A0D3IMT5_EMIH1|nr:hypothetical protein EMIHUDRAFT_445959 [Emiliania huxleyi CCMP1516]EOD12570.1 hypothetical protein EMIHUDRAFT_445959 [Emiliania huxleyi CCMP1516]|eukprot:XP_005764999.1 hypothetical protein EMIHUDRAFT_445959 [Emiliania huxleyi CCMP1516]
MSSLLQCIRSKCESASKKKKGGGAAAPAASAPAAAAASSDAGRQSVALQPHTPGELPQSGECGGLRMVVGSKGFGMLKGSEKQYVGVAAVLTALLKPESVAEPLRSIALAKREDIESLAERHALTEGANKLPEGEAAKKLLMLVGPPIEIAVLGAIGGKSSALARAKAIRESRTSRAAKPAAAAKPDAARDSTASKPDAERESVTSVPESIAESAGEEAAAAAA